LRILLVEDNQSLAGNIADFFTLKGISIEHASRGSQCLSLVAENHYDIIIMDVMMPGDDGFFVCEQLRKKLLCQVPILFLTAKVELEDKINGFKSGGDDYLTKPFELDELLWRVKALVNRGTRKDIVSLKFHDLELDSTEYSLNRAGQTIKLNQTQFKIVKTLMQRAPSSVTKQELEYEIWGDELPDSDVLRTQIYRLRNSMDKPFDHAYLETIHGQGYRLVAPE